MQKVHYGGDFPRVARRNLGPSSQPLTFFIWKKLSVEKKKEDRAIMEDLWLNWLTNYFRSTVDKVFKGERISTFFPKSQPVESANGFMTFAFFFFLVSTFRSVIHFILSTGAKQIISSNRFSDVIKPNTIKQMQQQQEGFRYGGGTCLLIGLPGRWKKKKIIISRSSWWHNWDEHNKELMTRVNVRLFSRT